MKSKRRGAVFVLALAVLAGLVMVLAAAASSQRLAVKAEMNRLHERRARLAATSAVNRVLALLVDQDKNKITQDDEWYTFGDTGDDNFVVDDVSFRVQVVDASSLLNINTINQEQMQKLGWTTEQIDSLLDFRNPGSTPRANGAKDDYYNGLTNAYNAKLRDLDTPDELLQVKGFTPDILYQSIDGTSTRGTDTSQTGQQPLIDLITTTSVSSDLDPQGQQKTNVNATQTTVQTLTGKGISPQLAGAIIQRRDSQRFTDIGEIFGLNGATMDSAKAVLDNLSIDAQPTKKGLIDLNTATQEILATVPNLTQDIVSAILSQQSTGFASLGDYASVSGMNLQLLQQTAKYFTVNTQTFILRIEARAGDFRRGYQAVVSIAGQSPQLMRIAPTSPDYIQRWGWNQDPTSDTVLSEAP